MPFDLASAKPIGESAPAPRKFDLASAKPVAPREDREGILSDESMDRLVAEDAARKTPGRPKMATRDPNEVDPNTGKTRGQLEAELDTYNQKRQSPLADTLQLGAEEGTRSLLARTTELAKGALGLPGLAEKAVTLPASAAAGRPIKGPFDLAREGLSPPELAPRNRTEEVAGTLTEALGGVPGGGAAGQVLAKTGGKVVQEVGKTLMAAPKAQVAGALASGGAAETAKGAGANELGQTIASILAPAAPGLAASRARPTAPRPSPNVADTPTKAARSAGYRLPPSSAGGPVGKVAEALGGTSQMGKKFAKGNEEVTTAHATAELGLPKGTRLTPERFAEMKKPHNEAYKAVGEQLGTISADDALRSTVSSIGAKTGSKVQPNRAIKKLREDFGKIQDMSADAVVQEVRSLREKASANMGAAFGQKNRVEMKELGKAQRAMADALDDWLERSVTALNDPTVVKNYKDARVALAKINTVERATLGGRVSTQKLAKADQKRPGVLTGRLKLAADAGTNFPEATGKAAPGTEIHVAPDTFFGTTRQVGQALLRPLIQRILQSDTYQNRIGRETGDFSETGPLGQYFRTPGPDFEPRQSPPFEQIPAAQAEGSMLRANQLAGDLDLVPEPVPGAQEFPPSAARPGDLQAETPPAQTGDLPFEASMPTLLRQLATELGLAPEAAGEGLPMRQGPVVDSPLGLAEDAPIQGQTPLGREFRDFDPNQIDFEPTDMDAVTPYRGPNTDLNFSDARPVAGTQRGAAVNLADDLELTLDDAEFPGTKPSASPVAAEDYGVSTLLGRPSKRGKVRSAVETGAFEKWIGPTESTVKARQQQQVQQQQAQAQPSLAEELGVAEIKPTTNKKYKGVEGYFDIVAPRGRIATVKGKAEAETLAAELGLEPKKAKSASKAAVAHEADETGQHTVTSKNGSLLAQESGSRLQVKRIDVKQDARGKGEGTSMMTRLMDEADALGLDGIASDTSVSPDQQGVYLRLEKEGFTVKQNPATVNPETGNLVSSNPRKPVYEVSRGKN